MKLLKKAKGFLKKRTSDNSFKHLLAFFDLRRFHQNPNLLGIYITKKSIKWQDILSRPLLITTRIGNLKCFIEETFSRMAQSICWQA
jgi:hypothetical protein